MRITAKSSFVTANIFYMRRKKLFIDSAAELRHHSNVKLRAVHIIDQIYKNLFGTALPEVMDKKQYFRHIVSVSSNYIVISNTDYLFLKKQWLSEVKREK